MSAIIPSAESIGNSLEKESHSTNLYDKLKFTNKKLCKSKNNRWTDIHKDDLNTNISTEGNKADEILESPSMNYESENIVEIDFDDDIIDTEEIDEHINREKLDLITLDIYDYKYKKIAIIDAIKGCDINFLDEIIEIDKYYPIHLAIKLNNIQMVRYFLDVRICDVNTLYHDTFTPLMLSLKSAELILFDRNIIYLLLNHQYIKYNLRNKDGQSAIHYAVYSKDKEILKLLINKVDNIYAIDNNGNNALHLACQRRSYNIVEFLISIYYDTNVASKDNIYALHYSVLHKSLDIFKLLFENVKDIYCKDKYGNNALHLVCKSYRNHIDLVTFMLHRSYDINNLNFNSYNAIHYSVTYHRFYVFKLLFDRVNDLYVKDKIFNNNILHSACQCRNYDVIKYLLMINYDISILNGLQLKAFDIKSTGESYLFYSVINNEVSSLKLIVGINNIYIKGKVTYHYNTKSLEQIHGCSEGGNILHLACKYGSIDVVNYLLSINYNVNITNTKNQNALHVSVIYNNLDIFKLLIEQVDDIHLKDLDGNNILLLATRYSLEILEHLISINYNINTIDSFDIMYTMFCRFIKNKKLDILKLLINQVGNNLVQSGVDKKILIKACMYGYYDYIAYFLSINSIILDNNQLNLLHMSVIFNKLEILKLLIVHTNDIYSKDNVGNNILHLACIYNHYTIIEYLLSINYDTNLMNNKNDKPFKIPSICRKLLIYTITNNRLEILKLVIDKVDDIYIVDDGGNNILHLSCIYHNHSIVNYLLSINYAINKFNYNNRNALRLSVIFNSYECFNILINKVDNAYCHDNDGNNILHLACIYGSIDIARYLLSINYNTNLTNRNNQSSIHISVINNRLDILKLLIDKLDNKYIKDKDGNDILHLASIYRHYDILKYLISINY